MKKTGRWFIEYPLGIAVYTVAAVLSAYRFTIAPFLLFVLLAGSEIVLFYRERRTFLDLRILFSASWLLGIALAALDLSELHSVWGVKTWFAAGLFYFGFLGGYEFRDFMCLRSAYGSCQDCAECLSVFHVFFAGEGV